MGRKPNTEVRRQEIVEALLQEMAATGYERASTKSIAARAGLTPGLVHYHFKSKEEILLALLDGLISEAERRCEEALAAQAAPGAKLAAYVSARVGLGPGADPVQVKAWVSLLAEAMGQARVRARLARWLGKDQERLAALFAEADAAEPEDKAALLLAMILGSFSLHAVQAPGVPRGYAEPRMLEWLKQALPRARRG